MSLSQFLRAFFERGTSLEDPSLSHEDATELTLQSCDISQDHEVIWAV